MSISKMIRLAVDAATCASAILLLTCFAFATYPGKNGRIVFIEAKSGNFQLYTMNPDGSDVLQITNLPPSQNPFWSPAYAPDGQQIVFSNDATGSMELYVVNADGSGLRQLTSDAGDDIFARWSRDGSFVLYSRLFIVTNQGAFHHLATINADGSNPQFLTHALFEDLQPAFFPDGKKIAFASTRENLRSALWLADANGSKAKRITEPPLAAAFPDVSPDGRMLVFHDHENTEYVPNIWMANVDGTALRRLTNSTVLVAGEAAFSPDGRKIVFVGNPVFPNPPNIYSMNPDGTGIKLIHECAEGCFTPNWGARQQE
jgi:Tol biopolymer transport system component